MHAPVLASLAPLDWEAGLRSASQQGSAQDQISVVVAGPGEDLPQVGWPDRRGLLVLECGKDSVLPVGLAEGLVPVQQLGRGLGKAPAPAPAAGREGSHRVLRVDRVGLVDLECGKDSGPGPVMGLAEGLARVPPLDQVRRREPGQDKVSALGLPAGREGSHWVLRVGRVGDQPSATVKASAPVSGGGPDLDSAILVRASGWLSDP